MISNVTGSIDRVVIPYQERLRATAEGWLSLLAAPTFAIMALLTGIHSGNMTDMLCSPIAGDRNGRDVFANERLPFGALAKATLQSTKWCRPLLILELARSSKRPDANTRAPSRDRAVGADSILGR